MKAGSIRRPVVLFSVLLIVLLLAFVWLKRPRPLAVSLVSVDRGQVEASIANTRAGAIEACRRTKLSPIMGGRIEVLAVREGDRVRKGDLLIKLWNDDQQAQEKLASAQLDAVARRVAEACTVAANARREAGRQEALARRGFVSSSREEAASAEAEAREASCAAARAEVASARARLAATRTEQGRTALYAPFDGTVAKIVGEVGEYSTPSPPGVPTPPAIDFFDDTCLYVKAPMDEVDAPKIAVGQKVRISLDALPGQHFSGRVTRLAPYVSALEKQARTVDVEAVFDDPQAPGRLLVGYSADLEIILETRDDVVRIPTAAILEGRRALVAAASGRLEVRQLVTGVANWEYTEVKSGLAAGERVVTSLDDVTDKNGALWVEEAKP